MKCVGIGKDLQGSNLITCERKNTKIMVTIMSARHNIELRRIKEKNLLTFNTLHNVMSLSQSYRFTINYLLSQTCSGIKNRASFNNK